MPEVSTPAHTQAHAEQGRKERGMSEREFIRRIAELWIDLGGDVDGVNWLLEPLKAEIRRQLEAEVRPVPHD